MRTSIARRALVGLALLVLVITTTAFWPNIPEVDKQSPLAAVNPAPSHVEWNSFPVGGFILVNPDTAARDSAGHSPAILIPEGSILMVPHLVPGADPDSSRDQS
jgi:hypothetical protein